MLSLREIKTLKLQRVTKSIASNSYLSRASAGNQGPKFDATFGKQPSKDENEPVIITNHDIDSIESPTAWKFIDKYIEDDSVITIDLAPKKLQMLEAKNMKL